MTQPEQSESERFAAVIDGLGRAGNALALLVDDYRPRSEPDSEEARALRAWDEAVSAAHRWGSCS